jgi:hypothetical protein
MSAIKSRDTIRNGVLCSVHAVGIRGEFAVWWVIVTVNEQNVPFVSSRKYVCVIFNKMFTWRMHRHAFRTCNILYSLYRSDRLISNIKLIFHKALVSSVLTNACPGWQFMADTHPVNLQCLQNDSQHHW